ncbi:MAG: lipocalin-like domain-containing protein [Candidatus Eisenbacteria bacterium]
MFVLVFAAVAAAGTERSSLRNAEGFQWAVPPYAFEFPRDHASHPRFQTEWWYYTGHLSSKAQRFGYELTFFRVGLPRFRAQSPSAWAARDLVFMHLALTEESAGRFRHHESARRASLDLAGADSTRYRVWLGDAFAGFAADGVTHRLRAAGPTFAIDLSLVSGKPPAIHGENGVSQKSPGRGNASHYYSLTQLATTGVLVRDGDTLQVEGRSWMDHEFATNGMAATHAGWDWFSVQLDDGRELMLYQLRRRGGTVEPLSHGTLVERDGQTRALELAEFHIESTGRWTSPRTGAVYPSGWVLRVPSIALEITLEPTLKDQELVVPSMGGVVYWEGSVRLKAVSRGVPVQGTGYVELTGYTGRAPF